MSEECAAIISDTSIRLLRVYQNMILPEQNIYHEYREGDLSIVDEGDYISKCYAKSDVEMKYDNAY